MKKNLLLLVCLCAFHALLYAQQLSPLPELKPNRFNAAGQRDGKWVIWRSDKYYPSLSTTRPLYEKSNTTVPDSAQYYGYLTFKNGKPVDTFRMFYRTGETYFVGKLRSFDADTLDGNCTFYFKTGEIFYKGLYINGKREGKHLNYFCYTLKNATPTLLSDYDFVNGEIRNIKNFFPDGSPADIMPFEGEGILYRINEIQKGKTKKFGMEGLWIAYYPDGSIKDTVTYENHMKVSLIRRQYDSLTINGMGKFHQSNTLVNFALRYFGKRHYLYIDALKKTAEAEKHEERKRSYLWTALKVSESVFGKGHEESVACLNLWIRAVGDLHTPDMYEKLMEAKKAWDSKTNNKMGAYSGMILHLFSVCNQLERYQEAEHYLLEYTKLGQNDPIQKKSILIHKANFYTMIQNYQEALNVYKEMMIDETPLVQLAKRNIIPLYLALGKPDSALTAAYDFFGGTLNNESSLEAFRTIAGIYYKSTKLDSCRIVLEKALRLPRLNQLDTSDLKEKGKLYDIKELLCVINNDPKQHVALVEQRFNQEQVHAIRPLYAQDLAKIYLFLGNYEKSKKYLDIYKNYIVNIYGKFHSQYFNVLSYEATYNYTKGDYKKALDTLQWLYANTISNKLLRNSISQELSKLYFYLGQYEDAFQLDTTRFAIEREIYGKQTYRNAEVWETFGRYALYKGDTVIAKDYLLQAIKVNEFFFGKKSHLLTTYNTLAQICEIQGGFVEALRYRDSIMLWLTNRVSENSRFHAQELVSLSQLYRKMGDYPKAIAINRQARNLFLKIAPDTLHLDYQRNNADFFYVQQLMNAPKSAFLAMPKHYSSFLKHIDKGFNSLDKMLNSENSKGQLLQSRLEVFNTYKTVSYQRAAHSETSQQGFLYDMALSQKEIVLNDARFYQLMKVSSDSTTFQTFLNWKQLNYQTLNAPFSFDSEKERIEWRKDSVMSEQLHEKLLQTYKIFKQARAKVTWQAVQMRLKDGEAAIEYDMVRPVDSDKTLYYVHILRKTDKIPVFLPLFDEKELKNLLDTSNLKDIRDAVITRYNNGGYGGGELYQLIWSKIDSVLKQSEQPVHTLFLATTGFLENIAFDILPTRQYSKPISQPDTLLLSDLYKIHRVRSTRELVLSNLWEPIKDNPKVLLYGSINYNSDSTVASAATGNKGGYFHATTVEPVELYPSMQDETRQVQQTCSMNHASVTVQQGNDATEGHFKALNRPFDILHFNTHGFYIENGLTDPLYRSYLAMAGCNKYLKNPNLKMVEDGLLTAHEIALVDLTQTQLVVLSACQTALGDIQGSEGVYGLRRALRLAGADFILVSLWNVPAEATTAFMTLFYQNLLKKMPIRAAFEQTQQTMRRNYPNPEDKYHWAAWVLIR